MFTMSSAIRAGWRAAAHVGTSCHRRQLTQRVNLTHGSYFTPASPRPTSALPLPPRAHRPTAEVVLSKHGRGLFLAPAEGLVEREVT